MIGKLGIIGLGRLGTSLLRGLSDEGRQIAVFSRTYKDEYRDFCFQEDMSKVVKGSETIFILRNTPALYMGVSTLPHISWLTSPAANDDCIGCVLGILPHNSDTTRS